MNTSSTNNNIGKFLSFTTINKLDTITSIEVVFSENNNLLNREVTNETTNKEGKYAIFSYDLEDYIKASEKDLNNLVDNLIPHIKDNKNLQGIGLNFTQSLSETNNETSNKNILKKNRELLFCSLKSKLAKSFNGKQLGVLIQTLTGNEFFHSTRRTLHFKN